MGCDSHTMDHSNRVRRQDGEMTYRDALKILENWPRTSLVNEPTPLVPALNLTQDLGLEVPILIKMDGETGFGLGGNKTRKLEFVLAPDRLDGVTHIITCGGVQSNHCRLTVAAAARLGLPCTLVLSGRAPEEPTGNALLHRLFGAALRPVAEREDRAPMMETVAAEVREAGGHALIVPLGASTPLGCLGYARAAVELNSQIPRSDGATWVFVSASSCGTFAGLVLGFALLERDDIRVVGVSPDVQESEIHEVTDALVSGSSALLGLASTAPTAEVLCTGDYIGGGYGVETPESVEAARMFAQREGVVLEQAYTAKVAAALIDWCRDGRIAPGETAVLWHTGGYPTVFA
jgi:L-cysteate sulfo-lyase